VTGVTNVTGDIVTATFGGASEARPTEALRKDVMSLIPPALEATPDQAVLRRAALASCVGTAVEWYDYFIFGSASALVFGRLFFPSSSPVAGTLSAFGVFGAGFLARPLGAVVFGHLGDRVGRKKTLVVTLMLMGLSTFAVGCLPTAASIGTLAPTLLVLCRLLQGFAVGGEWGGAALVAVEYAPEGQRGRYGSFPQIGSPMAIVMSTGAFALASQLPDDQFDAWGWRVPFLASVVLVGVGFFIRMRLTETPAFKAVLAEREVVRQPVVDTLRHDRRAIGLAILMKFSENVFGFIILTYIVSYATAHAGLSRSTALLAVTAAAIVGIFVQYWCGALSDRVGRRPVFLFGAVFTAVFAFPFFWLIDTGSPVLLFVALIVGYCVGLSPQYALEPSFFSELFPTRVRFSALSIATGVGSLVAGGLAPFIAAALVQWSGGRPWPVSLYILAGSVLSIIGALIARETHNRPLAMDRETSPVRAA
jgi:MHS family shikimate/dehydroshikimate transporter-like MFS transporter